MLPKPTVMASLLLGGSAVLGIASWMRTPALAQRPGAAAPADRGGEARAQSMDNFKMILLAFHNFLDANGHLPPSAIYGADGLPKLSWRVALLPYLDEGDLYNEFKQDEPWDSPHNKALIGRMPAVFQTPSSPAPAGKTRIRGFAGKGALFDGVQGIGLAFISDGTSNTVLIAAAREATTWTEPGDLPFTEGQPLPALDESDPEGHLIGLCDGSVRYLPPDAGLLRKIITRAGGEIIVWPPPPSTPVRTVPTPLPTASPTPRVIVTPGMPGAGMATPGISPSPGLDQRLQRVEEKLDRVLKKLDSLTDGKP